jgi:hypothetical protein
MKKTPATYYGSVGIQNINRKNMAHSKYGAHCAPQHNILVPNPSTLPFDIMPRSIQPGGLAHQMRVQYTACRKLGLLTAVERLQHEEGLTLRKAAECLLVCHSLIVRWKKQQSAGPNDPFVALTRTSKNKKATHVGPLGQLKEIEGPLLRHIFELCKQGVTVSTFKWL